MIRFTLPLLAVVLLVSCASGTKMWIPQGSSRPAVAREHVQYLEQPPQRPYAVVGIITPPAGEYDTLAEAVNDMCKVAAKHGADAIYIESATEQGGWRFGFGGGRGGGGTFSTVQYRAKAIVWK